MVQNLQLYRRFVDDAFGFALTWNYWFNDAVSTASDLVALQLLLQYWTDNFPGWALSLIFLAVLIGLNIVSVKVYGEMEYWLSFLKIVTIVVRCIPTILLLIVRRAYQSPRSLSSSALPSTVVVTLRANTSAAKTGTLVMHHSSVASVGSLPSL